jgi:hypothetical protein
VAGRLADAGWNIYFPHRDKGFDFIISKTVGDDLMIKPVQVKGKYPTSDKTDKVTYGYVGKLSALHPDMVLAIPYFSSESVQTTPICVVYIPRLLIKNHSRGYRCQPASFKGGEPRPRREYSVFFDAEGIKQMELVDWARTAPF